MVVDLPKDPISGKRRQKCVTVHGSKRKADFELEKLLKEAQHSRARDSSVLVESAIRESITLVSQNLSPTTVRGYMGWIDLKIVPALGMLPLAEVTAAHLDRLYRDRTVLQSGHEVGVGRVKPRFVGLSSEGDCGTGRCTNG
ncbi:hypothetical protein [Ferrimicrobium acidiphilum]|uniref:hypothetical protein n=1 Tax=Ferrimicrobium acidiphilum TaxID=121039 RepID=UPI0023F0C77F|nr:hypothetical protein [Ferrimicrobium acidiphilum]